MERPASAGALRLRGELAVEPGDVLPAVVLPSTAGHDANVLEAARGSHIVLFFYPGDREGLRYRELSGCTLEGRDFRDGFDALHELAVVVYGVEFVNWPAVLHYRLLGAVRTAAGADVRFPSRSSLTIWHRLPHTRPQCLTERAARGRAGRGESRNCRLWAPSRPLA